MKTIKIECPKCGGTGLYQGICERDGAAVVCYACKGSGAVTFSYNEFTGRKRRNNVRRVYESGGGYVISAEDKTLDNGETIRFSQFGCGYEEWLAGCPPLPIKDLYCPNLLCHDNLVEGCEDCRVGSYIYECPHYANRAACWEQYEKAKTV
mgnify:FL=1